MKWQKQRGFTLVELAIVLVIIGLLVGGVMVGQDLIAAAMMRKTMAQLEGYNVAANSFRSKYQNLPGDMLSANAQAFNMAYMSYPGPTWTGGYGDGNGFLQSATVTASLRIDMARGEITLFWRQMADAGLIANILPGITGTSVTAVSAVNATSAANFVPFFPQLAVRPNSFFYPFSNNGRHYYYLTALQSSDANSSIASVSAVGPALTPGEAKSLDEKLDDGAPTTGTVYAAGVIATTTIPVDAGAAPASGVCVNSTATPKIYNVINAYRNELNCQLAVRSSF